MLDCLGLRVRPIGEDEVLTEIRAGVEDLAEIDNAIEAHEQERLRHHATVLVPRGIDGSAGGSKCDETA